MISRKPFDSGTTLLSHRTSPPSALIIYARKSYTAHNSTIIIIVIVRLTHTQVSARLCSKRCVLNTEPATWLPSSSTRYCRSRTTVRRRRPATRTNTRRARPAIVSTPDTTTTNSTINTTNSMHTCNTCTIVTAGRPRTTGARGAPS